MGGTVIEYSELHTIGRSDELPYCTLYMDEIQMDENNGQRMENGPGRHRSRSGGESESDARGVYIKI